MGSNKAHWLSEDGIYIAYAEYNESQVPIYKFQKYGPGTSIYGQIDEIAYPKVFEDLNQIGALYLLTGFSSFILSNVSKGYFILQILGYVLLAFG